MYKNVNHLHLRVLIALAKVFLLKIHLEMDLSRTTIVMSAQEAYSRLLLVEIPVQQSNRPEGRPSDFWTVSDLLTLGLVFCLLVYLNEVFNN